MVPPEETFDDYRYFKPRSDKELKFKIEKSRRRVKSTQFYQATWETVKNRRLARAPFYKTEERLYCVYYAYQKGTSKIYEGRAVRVHRCCTSDAVAESCNIDFVIDDQMRVKLRKSLQRTINSMGYWYEIVKYDDLHKFQKDFLERPIALVE